MYSPWLTSDYKKCEDVKHYKLKHNNEDFYILINPEIGSWACLNSIEFDNYNNGKLEKLKWENLYLRNLAITADGGRVEHAFPKPAEYPSLVVVNITTRCNLNCKYCFANCSPENGEDMPENVMIAIIRQMLMMPEVDTITFEFQGGEPTINFSGMLTFIELSEKMKINYNKKIKYRLESNGTNITNEFIELVKRYNIDIGISIDGPQDMTDGARIYPDGHGAFKDIETGIEKLFKSELKIKGAVCTLGKHNIFDPLRLVKFFNEKKIDFKPRPANILGREIISKITTTPGEWANFFRKMYYPSKRGSAENFAIHIFEENVYTPIRDYICLRWPCGAAREVISVNPDGNVYPCDGFKAERKFAMGNILTEPIVDMLRRPWVVKMRNRTWHNIEKCGKCTFRGMCCSCCYSAYGAYGTIWREDPHCIDRMAIFKFLINNWIKGKLIEQHSG